MWLPVWIDLKVAHKGKVKVSKLQPKYFGVWPLRFSKKFKLNRLPADCVILLYNGSQNTAKFRAGRISLPAKTGNDNNNKTAVITTAQANKINLCNLIPGLLMLNVVVMKFIAPSKLEIPERCNPKIAKSTLGPL
jgi:hypothetical protein